MDSDEHRTIWFGDVDSWMDEAYVHSLFAASGGVTNVKIIRDKRTGLPAGYGFVEFATPDLAQRVLESMNGTPIPGLGRNFRLNWATHSGAATGGKRVDTTPEYSIFVGDLGPEVNDYMLQQAFILRYPSVTSAKVVTDQSTGQSKGYGFVRFSTEMECNRAMAEMQGQYCGSRPMRLATATQKKHAASEDLSNTTLFIGNLSPSTTEEDLRMTFAEFGDLGYIKIPPGKGCGFVQFGSRGAAEAAMAARHGSLIAGQPVRIAWGRSSSSSSSSPSHGGGYGNYSGGYAVNYYGRYPRMMTPHVPSGRHGGHTHSVAGGMTPATSATASYPPHMPRLDDFTLSADQRTQLENARFMRTNERLFTYPMISPVPYDSDAIILNGV